LSLCNDQVMAVTKSGRLLFWPLRVLRKQPSSAASEFASLEGRAVEGVSAGHSHALILLRTGTV
jgi:hypothetical protein